MTCPCEKPNHKKMCKAGTPPVLEVHSEECPVLFHTVVIPASAGDPTTMPPEPGMYRNVRLTYEATGDSYLFDSDGIPQYLANKGIVDSVNGKIGVVVLDAEDVGAASGADINDLQSQIDALAAASDVTDIVGTYADLMAYDTSKLKDNDIIKVLQDETHDGETAYYRWVAVSSTFSLIGEEGPYYTKSAADAKFQDKLTFDNTPTAGSNNPVISSGIKTYVDTKAVTFKPYPSTVNTTGTTAQFISSIQALDAEVGMAYLGTVTLSDLPAGLIQEEVEAYIYDNNLVYCTLRSADTPPYQWWCASYDFQGWRPVNTDTTYTAGTNISISSGNVISATDTTYSNFVGTDGVDPGTAGLVPAPTTSDTDKYLKSDGTWATVSGGSSVTLYTDIGQNTDGALTQKCATDLLFNGSSKSKVQIGSSASATSSDSIAIGTSATANSQYAVSIGQGAKAGSGGICIGRKSSSDTLGSQSVAIGVNALAKGSYAICLGQSNASASGGIAIGKDAKAGVNATNSDSIAIGEYSKNEYSHSIALGAFSQTRAQGVIDISTGNTTYNLKSGYQGVNDAQRTQYKVISGVHDGEDDHDAMTVGQVKTLAYKLVTVDPSQNNTPADFIGQIAIWYEEPVSGLIQLRGRFVCTVIDTTQTNPFYGWSSF